MLKKNLFIKIILSVVALGLIVLCVILLKDSFKPNYDGNIIIEVLDLDGSTIKEKEISFNEGDLLTELVSNNFDNVTYDNGMLMSIENFTTPSDWSKFISIYVNDEMSMVGLFDIKFEDGTKISFIITEFDPNEWN